MNPVDWIILAAVLGAFGAAVFFGVRRKKRGCCSGDCSSCGGVCPCEKKADKSE